MCFKKLMPNRILSYIFVFLVLFQPLIFPFNVLHFLSVAGVAILVVNRNQVLSIFHNKQILWFFGFNLLYMIYSFAVSVSVGRIYPDFYSSFLFAVELPICVLSAYILCKNSGVSIHKAIIFAGLIQSVIAIGTLLIPGLQEAVIKLYIRRGFPVETEWFIGKRFFGFSTQLTYTMPIIQTVLAILVLHNLKDKKQILKSAIYTFLLLISAIINARSTLVILILGIIYLLFDKRAYLKRINYRYYILTFSIFLIVAVAGYFISPSTFAWIAQGFNEVFFIFTGKYKGSYFDIIFSNFFFIPETVLSFIFGSGINVFTQTVNGLRSDVGFIVDLWYTGLIGCVLKYTGTLVVLFKNIKKDSFCVFILLTLLAANIKGIAFENNELMALISFYILSLCNVREDSIEK